MAVDHAPLDRLERALVAERPHLVGVAYRVTGSRVEAEDIVQEAWLRARRADPATIENPEAWLTTVVSRLALDTLKSARVRRESYVGPYLPEPVPTGGALAGRAARVPAAGGAPSGLDDGADDGDPAGMAERAESLTFGFLRVLDTLGPVERVVFLLADVFDVPYTQIAEVVGRSPEACRQVASRARRRVRAERPEHAPPAEAQAVASQLLDAFAAADVDRLVALLGEECVLISDGGPRFRAARRPIVGPDRVSRFMAWLARRYADLDVEVEAQALNGEPGIVIRQDGEPLITMAFGVAAGRVATIHIVRNPDKLAGLDLDAPVA